MSKVDHIPEGDPCSKCGQPARVHRIDHHFRGHKAVSCNRCKWPASIHRNRTREGRIPKPGPRRSKYKGPRHVGIDGEGQGRIQHRYVLLAASDEDGQNEWFIENPNGLSTEECLEFIVGLPRSCRIFAYSFGYDLTKILADVDDRALWMLFRPERRQRYGKEAFKGPYTVRWKNWLLNLQGTKFSVGRLPEKGKKRPQATIIWDVWKFYQSKFTKALEDWKVGEKEMIAQMVHMKDKRADFDKESSEAVLEYCLGECRSMATLAKRLDEAHKAVGIKLKNYYGAGSSASGMLDLMKVKDYMCDCPEELRDIVASAFFGGRFDNSRLGPLPRKVWGYDISSAYPYQATFLPCLIHGRWEWTQDRKAIERARLACVHYGLSDITRSRIQNMAWGPLPFRTRDGSICYPAVSGGGWVWKDEYLAAEQYYDHVWFREAYCYHTDCDCRPFEKLPAYYLERLRIGKEGPGIILKLASNSVYGKLAQSVGRGMYNSWIWAGNITSGCRAQVLHAINKARDPWSVTMVATDGIQSLEELKLDLPRDTGTDLDVTAQDTGKTTRKPLGGWECKPVDKGVFYARPGVYFPMNPTADEREVVRGRGVGRGVVLENWERIVDTYNEWARRQCGTFPNAEDEDEDYRWPLVKVANVSRFCGAKSSISRYKDEQGLWAYKRARGDHLGSLPKPHYGEWITREVSMSFNPKPKRSGLLDDGQRLMVRHMGAVESAPYDKAKLSPEARELLMAEQERIEQPDMDYADYESMDE